MPELPLNKHDVAELRWQCRHHSMFPLFLPNVYHESDSGPVLSVLKPLLDECILYLSAMTATNCCS
jgi:hypothetical protein